MRKASRSWLFFRDRNKYDLETTIKEKSRINFAPPRSVARATHASRYSSSVHRINRCISIILCLIVKADNPGNMKLILSSCFAWVWIRETWRLFVYNITNYICTNTTEDKWFVYSSRFNKSSPIIIDYIQVIIRINGFNYAYN